MHILFHYYTQEIEASLATTNKYKLIFNFI